MQGSISMFFSRLTMTNAVGIGAGLVFSLMFWFGIISPLHFRSQQASAQLQKIARERQRYAGVITSLKRVSDDVTHMQAKLAASSLHLLPKDALNHRLADLEGVASDLGLKIKEIKPSDPFDDSRFVIVPIVIAGQGTYPSCACFIHQVHVKFPDLNVSRLRLSASQEAAQGGCDYEMELRWLTVPTGGNVEHFQTASVNE